jgi:hypothetical protein
MESLTIEGTQKTPGITADAGQGLIEIRGRSHPENTAEFYRPLMDWADEYVTRPLGKTTINIELEYFNTSTSKVLLNILRKFEAIGNSRENVLVNWYYEDEDEDELETGEYYAQILNLGFNYIGV